MSGKPDFLIGLEALASVDDRDTSVDVYMWKIDRSRLMLPARTFLSTDEAWRQVLQTD
jgi:hypothetical protein